MLRNTHQKQAVYTAVCRLKGTHPSADEVFAAVRDDLPTISRATVYRILNNLAEQNSVIRVCFPQSADRFDANTALHEHICCEKCGKVFDTEYEAVPRLKLPDSCDGRVTGYKVVYTGICNACTGDRQG